MISHCFSTLAELLPSKKKVVFVFLCKAMKGFQTSPAHSCKDIRDSGDSKGDGKYWIDPKENRNHFRCYCDMKTDGGDLLTIVQKIGHKTQF